jgi:serine/threonine protein kinase
MLNNAATAATATTTAPFQPLDAVDEGNYQDLCHMKRGVCLPGGIELVRSSSFRRRRRRRSRVGQLQQQQQPPPLLESDHDENDTSIDDEPPAAPLYLVAESGATQGYAVQLNKEPLSLNHHGKDWGVVWFAIVYPRIGPCTFVVPTAGDDTSDHDDDDDDVNDDADADENAAENAAAAAATASRISLQRVVIKQLNRRAITQHIAANGSENPYKEIYRSQSLGDNQHVLRLVDVLFDDHSLYIISPQGITLKDAITWGPQGGIVGGPQRAIQVFEQLLQILVYLQQHHICHHDMSPDNFLFLDMNNYHEMNDNPLSECNLVVYDMAKSILIPHRDYEDDESSSSSSQLTLLKPATFGTWAYQPPEGIVGLPYNGHKFDLWACVLILYNMMTGFPLYRLPLPVDVCFTYFILARGLSSHPNNERTTEILLQLNQEVNAVNINQQQQNRHLLRQRSRQIDFDRDSRDDEVDDNSNNDDNTSHPVGRVETTGNEISQQQASVTTSIKDRRTGSRRSDARRDQNDIVSRCLAQLALDDASIELFENCFRIEPEDRWSIEQIRQSHCFRLLLSSSSSSISLSPQT